MTNPKGFRTFRRVFSQWLAQWKDACHFYVIRALTGRRYVRVG
jgi:hypothetical protein